ncbi:hypothetical protein SLE2022_015900 [Rubroshorea leprosula]
MDTGFKNFQSINEAPSSGDLNTDTLAKSNTSTPAMATSSGKEGSSSTHHIVIPPQGQLNQPDEYGPWLIVDRRKKRSSQKPAMESKSTVEKKTTKGNRDHGEPNHRSGPSNQSVHKGSYAFKANGKVAGALNAKSQFKAVNATVQSKTVVGTRNDKLNPNFLASSSEAKSSQISEEGDAKDFRNTSQSKVQLSLGPNAVILEQTSTGSQSPTAQNSSPLEVALLSVKDRVKNIEHITANPIVALNATMSPNLQLNQNESSTIHLVEIQSTGSIGSEQQCLTDGGSLESDINMGRSIEAIMERGVPIPSLAQTNSHSQDNQPSAPPQPNSSSGSRADSLDRLSQNPRLRIHQ